MQFPEHKPLTASQIADSRQAHGSNLLTTPKRRPLWLQFSDKFRDPLIIILLIAGMLSIGVSTYEYCALDCGIKIYLEPIGIFIAILLATGLAFIFEIKAEKEFEILNRVNDEEPVQVIRRVVRDGREQDLPMTIAKKDVVVGDIAILATGQEIPADGILTEAVTMSIDESTLTGEQLCHKTTDERHFDSEATYASNRVMRSTKVMEGHGVMVVTAVGDSTEYGHVHTMSHIASGKKTPLDEQFARLGKMIAWSSYAIGILIMTGRIIEWFVWHTNGDINAVEFTAYILQSMMIAVTLVVCAVPEGLPMAVTLSLAYSMRRMLKTNNLVRKMHACETMGEATVICTDKTGTLTQNRMTVCEIQTVADLSEAMAVNSTAVLDADGCPIGNPTEGALLMWLRDQGKDYQQLRNGSARLCELPFSTERKLMATMIRSAATGKIILHVKGAPEIIATLCGRETPAELTEWQNRAMRTLAFASLTPDASEVTKDDEWTARDIETLLGNAAESPFTWLGAVGISDPLRDDVAAAADECRAAGIEIKMVTGDTPSTAAEIARQIGILPTDYKYSAVTDIAASANGYHPIITGTEFAALSDDELMERVPQISIIARARPMDKQRLVGTLQRIGHVVAVTGDGTNDAPALKTADVGLSMGDGTSVAKEASDITIIDNSFASIGRAVMWGRSLYQNIQRFVMFQMTINVVACAVVLAGSFMDTVSPLSVTQMLWVNLIMDTFAAMALASLPPNKRVMLSAPRQRTAFIISRAMVLRIVGTGTAFAVLLIGLLYRMQHVDSSGDGNVLFNILTHTATPHCSLSTHEASLFFTVFVMLQFWNMFNARAFATNESGLRLRGCKGFIIIAATILIGQIMIVNFGGEMFNVQPISATEWITIFIATSPVLWIGELTRSRKTATL